MAQDFSRALINIFSNAFYAVTERRKNATSLSNYDPTVTVITRKTQQAVEIIVQDNGMGKTTGIDQVGNMFRFQPGQPVSCNSVTYFGGDIIYDHAAN